MIRTLTILTAFAAIAAPAAAAADIKINIVGKDAPTVQAEIRKAAITTCRQDLRGATGSVSALEMCRRAVTADALEQFARARASYLAASKPADVALVSAAD